MSNHFTFRALAVSTIALFAVGFLSPAAHADTNTNSAAALKGTWTGPSSGYEGSTYTTGFEKIVITKVKGSSALGTWQYKTSAGAKWSSPKPSTFNGFVGKNGSYIVNGVDAGGTYFGHLTPEGEWTLTYQSSDRLMSLQFELKKQ
jgi:hypothetical protein